MAKKRLGVGYEYGGLQIQTAEEIATGLGCNFIQRVMKNNSKEKKLFMKSHISVGETNERTNVSYFGSDWKPE